MITNKITEEKIIEVENQLLEAMKKSDVLILNELLHDDLIFILPNGQKITKEIDIETHKTGNLVFTEIHSTIDSINLIEQNAVITLSSKIKGKMFENYFEGEFRYLRIWKIFDNQLKVIAGSCVQI